MENYATASEILTAVLIVLLAAAACALWLQRRVLRRLRSIHKSEAATLAAAPDGVLWVDPRGRIMLANPAMETLTGYAPKELLGQNVAMLLPPHLRERHAQSMQGFFHHPQSRAMGQIANTTLHRKDGGSTPVDISLGQWTVDGQRYAIAYLRDSTDRKNFEESLRHQATHDRLTGLPNRWLFQLQLKQALLRIERNRLQVAVLFLDLDNFKTVNDTFGHQAGDTLLIQAGQRIQSTLRKSDVLARMGGDEFAVLLPDIESPDQAVSVASKILKYLEEPFELSDQRVYAGGSIGIAYYPTDAQDGETLLRYADMAMYQAKQSGRGNYVCYSAELNRRAHEDMQMYTRLKAAISDRSLSLHFQPQVRMHDAGVIGAEVLLRWNDGQLGQVPPGRFIPLAEKTGLIQPLSDWVLEAACEHLAAWQRRGMPIRLAVNISAYQFMHGQLADKVRELLVRTGVQAHWLELEITESVAMSQPQMAKERIQALAALGCSISLDDFGTGYSSLAYLKDLPIDKIKIDQSFVQDINEDPGDDFIVQTVIAMAHNLGLSVIAEGVETQAQSERLALYGCQTCQGYYYYRPMPLQEFEQLLSRKRASIGKPLLH